MGGGGGGKGNGFLDAESCREPDFAFESAWVAFGFDAVTVTAPRLTADGDGPPVNARTERVVPAADGVAFALDDLFGEAALLVASGRADVVDLPVGTNLSGLSFLRAATFVSGFISALDLMSAFGLFLLALDADFASADGEPTTFLAVEVAAEPAATLLPLLAVGFAEPALAAGAGFNFAAGLAADAFATMGFAVAAFAAVGFAAPVGESVLDVGFGFAAFAGSVAAAGFADFALVSGVGFEDEAGFGEAAGLEFDAALAAAIGFVLDAALCFGEADTESSLLMTRQM
jgi:hypothetical protein